MMDLWHRAPEPLWQKVALLPLEPLALAFGAGSALRRSLYASGRLHSEQAAIPVLSVGNLAVGGAGKTPVTLHLAGVLSARGHRPAILSRGHGGEGRGPRIVSRGNGPLLPASEVGDEPVLLARRCPGTLVLVGPQRAELARMAAGLGATVALLDDGFQHLALRRNLDVVVLDGSAPFANGRLLPRGPLRELPSALQRAHLAWIAKADQGGEAMEEAASLAHRLTGLAPVRSRYAVEALVGKDGPLPLGSLRGARVLLACGIARPGSFRALLEGLGADVVGQVLFADHQALDMALVQARALAASAHHVCCTEKDAVKLGPGEDVVEVRIRTEILQGEASLEASLSRVALG